MIIIYRKHLSLFNNFEVAEGYHPVIPTILSRYSPIQLFPKHYKSSCMITFTSLDSAIGQCIRGLHKSAYRYVFRILVQRLEYFKPRRIHSKNVLFILLFGLYAFEISHSINYISNNNRVT